MKVQNKLALIRIVTFVTNVINIGSLFYIAYLVIPFNEVPVVSQPQHALTDDEIIGGRDTVAARTERRVQDDLDLCTKPYRGPGSKADCDAARKVLFQEGFRSM